ncbi:Phosphate ABC transporter substrate-binding protein (PhoT family) (modular protein) [Marinoscillum sp. 108]|nr:Phosphate ABC transporter substrate-binding protein (PhoT family) (modular protein) [Marinoscillum sp. 108]
MSAVVGSYSSFVFSFTTMKTIHYASIIALLTIAACSQPEINHYQLRIKGSESMYETFLELKNDFEKRQDSIIISLEGGGSRTGLMAIKNHEAEIGLSSFPFDLEKTLGSDHHVSEAVVAYDAIVVITNQNNPIDSLSDESLQKIYSGTVYDWNQLGGRPGLILPIIRDENSGTQQFFVEHFGVKQLAPTAKVAHDNAEIVAKVSSNPNGIGFIGFAYFTESVHNMKLPSDSTQTQFEAPTHRNLENGKYPLKRGLRIYYRDTNNPAISGFLQYLKSKHAEGVIESFGLIPVQDKSTEISAGQPPQTGP